MRKFFNEFKQFISRGNIVDLSVAVIIGAAFSAIVTALTDKIIKPLVNWVLSICGGTDGLESAYTILKGVYDSDGKIILDKSIYIDWGAFVAAIINFIIIAFTVFCIVKAINSSTKKLKDLQSTLKNEMKKEIREEKKAIRQKANEEGREFKEVWNEYLEEKKKLAEIKAKEMEEERLKMEAEEKKLHPTQEELLFEIKELLASQVKNSSKSTKKQDK